MNQVRMKKVYYNCEIINQTNSSIDAKYDVGLLKALIDNPTKYNINVNRFRLPLNGVPLTKNNIPFLKWHVSLGYYNNNNNKWEYSTAYTPQVNPTIVQSRNFYNYTNDHKVELVGNNLQNYFTKSSIELNGVAFYNSFSPVPTYVQPCFDFYNNIGTVYALSSNQRDVKAFNLSNGYLLYTFTLTLPAFAIYADSDGNLYIGTKSDNNTIVVYSYARQKINVWNASTSYVFTNVSSSSASFIYSLTLFNGQLFASYFDGNNNSGGINYYALGTSTPTAFPTSFGGTVSVFLESNGTFLFVTYSTVSAQSYLAMIVYDKFFNQDAGILPCGDNFVNGGFIGFDSNGNLLLNGTWFDGQTTTAFRAINGGTTLYKFNPTNGCHNTFYAPNATTYVTNNAEQPIYHYQTFLNQINEAFSVAFTNIKAEYPSYSPTEAPRIVFNPSTRLFNVIADGSYLDNSTYKIGMNINLWNMFLFPTFSDTDIDLPTYQGIPYKSLLIQNNVYNVVYGTGNAVQYVSIIQESPTLFKFYDLVRILVTTSKIPVNGDCEGANNTVNLITDIVPDTSSLTPDDIIVYQPTVLRNYNLDSNVPLKDLDVQFYYGCKDGSVHKVQLLPNEYASVKIEFEQVVE